MSKYYRHPFVCVCGCVFVSFLPLLVIFARLLRYFSGTFVYVYIYDCVIVARHRHRAAASLCECICVCAHMCESAQVCARTCVCVRECVRMHMYEHMYTFFYKRHVYMRLSLDFRQKLRTN